MKYGALCKNSNWKQELQNHGSRVYNAVGQLTSFDANAPGQPFQYGYSYDAAGRVSQVTAIPPCPTGLNCLGQQTTLSRYNGHNQRYLRENGESQTVFTYGPDGYSVLSETDQRLNGATTETIYLPTASGPMPVVAVIGGETFAVYADHLNTPRRLTDAQGRPRWQWAFSGFGEQAAQSIPVVGKSLVTYSLRYPGQVDDGNGLFYNFNRFYDPLAGRYTNADPIGLEGGWNRFGYVGGNALGAVDPLGLSATNTRHHLRFQAHYLKRLRRLPLKCVAVATVLKTSAKHNVPMSWISQVALTTLVHIVPVYAGALQISDTPYKE